MKRVRVVLLIVFCASTLTGYGLRRAFTSVSYDEGAALRQLSPSETFGGKTGLPPHYRGSAGTVAFNTSDINPGVRGYAGPITMMITLAPEGRISGLRVLDHRETKNYVHYLVSPEYLQRLTGKSVNDPFVIDRDVDAVSRATVSLEAMARTIRDSSRIVTSAVLGIPVMGDGAQDKTDLGWLWYLLVALSAFTLYLATRRSHRLLRLRDLSLALSVAVIGLLLATPFSVLQVYNLLLGRPASSALWYVVLISSALSIAAAGRFYCGWLCPFGAVSEFLGRLPVRKWRIPVETDDRWRRAKYAVLGITAAAVLIGGRTDYGNVETYVTLFSRSGSYLAWALVAITLAANLRIERFWCRYLCPAGALTGALSREARGYPSRHDCPMANRPDPLISECIRCNRCRRPSAGHANMP